MKKGSREKVKKLTKSHKFSTYPLLINKTNYYTRQYRNNVSINSDFIRKIKKTNNSEGLEGQGKYEEIGLTGNAGSRSIPRPNSDDVSTTTGESIFINPVSVF